MKDQRWTIPEQLFVGFSRKVRGHAPLAAFTGAGTDSGAKSRMQTVTNNSTQTWTLDNAPQWGITLGRNSWRDEVFMEDPRGFSVSVRMDHVLQLLKECIMVDGVIQAPCVWARTNGQNMLLVVGSETHQLAQTQTRLANTKVSVKHVKLGDWVTLQNGVQGVYLGKYHRVLFDDSPWYNRKPENKLKVDETARMVIHQPQYKKISNPHIQACVMFLSTAQIAEHQSHNRTYTDTEAELYLHELMHSGSCDVQRTTRGYYSERVLFATRKLPELNHIRITPEPVTYAHADEVGALMHKVFYKDTQDKWFMWGNQNRGNVVSMYDIDPVALAQTEIRFITQLQNGYHQARSQHMPVSQALTDLHVFTASYTTALGNHLSCHI
jgi:hypothetical protein